MDVVGSVNVKKGEDKLKAASVNLRKFGVTKGAKGEGDRHFLTAEAAR